ncbi:cupredoxin domain-containing protein [Geodermatophilus marinus]|uniref:cupredoxin domain-containing protein n=1 Tax=Geodermatophilus sp. LHW52908 TaxID=2303986 RepID=UPI001314BA02|nr:cupredoxin domain-containing protein [Geodermatophilus sp. LHW52908]
MHPATTRPTRRIAAAVLALALGGLTACSGDGGAEAADPAATTTGETSSPAPSTTTEAPGATTGAPGTTAEAPAPAAETVSVTADEFSYELSEDSYSPGTYTFEVTNSGNMPHDFVVERDGADVAATPVLRPGESATLEVALEAGDYAFYCSVGNHRAQGMETAVTVAG